MRKSRIITIFIVLLCLLAVLAGGVVLCRHYLPTPGPTHALFERYKSNSHIDACLLRDFRINDTLTADVITLQADNDSAWCALLLDFGAPAELIELYKTNKEFFVGENVNTLTMFYIDKNNPRKQLPNTNPDSRLVILSHVKRSLCIFMTEKQNSKEQIVLSKTKNLKR